MSEEKKPSVLLEHKPQLDGGWSFQAQFKALNGTGSSAEDDLTFKESSVKDVSDRGRGEGAARLQKALEIALTTAPARTPKRKALKMEEEVDVGPEVRTHLATLKQLRGDGPTEQRDPVAMDVLRQLGDLKVSVACLQATKIAAEVNQPFWRGTEVSKEIRQYATSLVRAWRTMYRDETGTTEAAMPPAVRSRKCRNLSMDLEECAYGRHQKVSQYIEVIDHTCRIIMGDIEVSRALLAGTLISKALLARASEEIRHLKASKKHGPKTAIKS